MKRLFTFCMLFFLCVHIGNAQQEPTRHKVARGETILQIAKKYNVTPYDIQQANRDTLESLDDIKENDVLIIPKSKITTPQPASAADAIKASVAEIMSSYTVKKGDTKYGLAKRFGISIPELEALNPHIVPGLNEGHVLRVNGPVNDFHKPPTMDEDQKEPPVSFEGYKSHLVLKGETLWGISHANGLTVEQLVGENTDVLTGILREGQTLKIPQIQQDATPYERYLVKYGDTKYGLSKKYGTTIEALERLNPHIIRMLQAGHTVRIPTETLADETREVAAIEKPSETPTQAEMDDSKVSDAPVETNQKPIAANEALTASQTEAEKDTLTETALIPSEIKTEQTPSQDSEPYVLYEIKPKETLYGLSKKAGMSIADFVVLNPQLKESVQIGALIKMPNADAIGADRPEEKPATKDVAGSPVDLSKTMDATATRNLMFFLPFSESEFQAKAKQVGEFMDDSDAFKKAHLEFYSGAKMAIDSIRKSGYNLSLTFFEINNNKRNSKLSGLLNDSALLNSDAIILPFYEHAEEAVATAVAEKEIPVITAATIAHQTNLNNLFSALPSINEQRKKMLDYLVSKHGNIVVVSDVNRAESRDYILEHVPQATIVELKKNGTFSETELVSNFKKDQLNYVILNSERNSVFLNVTNILLSELNRYSIQLAVLEDRIIPDDDDVSVKRFRILKMLFPSLGSAQMALKSGTFQAAYEKVYRSKPSENAVLGFDVTYDTLVRLFQAETFEASATKDITAQTKLTFDYERNTHGGYSNQGIYILQYDTNSNLQQAD